MSRDIDYAAIAVRNAILAKFDKSQTLGELSVAALEKTIVVRQGGRQAEGTRDQLLAALRSAETYDQFWESCFSPAR